MRWFFLLLICVSGCGFDLTVPPNGPTTPDDKQPVVATLIKAKEVWKALARRIDSGVISETDRLQQIVQQMKDAGELSEGDQKAFLAAFPGIDAKRRPTTPQDANTLRGL